MSLSVITDAADGITSRLSLLGIIPSILLILFLYFLVISITVPPTLYPDLNLILEKIEDITAQQALVLVILILALSVLIEPLQLSLLKAFEGYWSKTGILGSIRNLGIAIQFRRSKIRKYSNLTDLEYPSEYNSFLPTSLGNRLKVAELRAGNKYQLETITFWPRLYPLLPDAMKKILDDRRNQLDISVRYCSILIIAIIASIVAYLVVVHNAIVTDTSLIVLSNSNAFDEQTEFLLYSIAFVKYGLWLLIPIGAWILYWVSYKSALAIASSYGIAMRVAFDLYRFDLLKSLHWPLPSNFDDEQKKNNELTNFLLGTRNKVKYVHLGETNDTTPDPATKQKTVGEADPNIEAAEYLKRNSSVVKPSDEGNTIPNSGGENRPNDNSHNFETSSLGKIIIVVGMAMISIGLLLCAGWIINFESSIDNGTIPIMNLMLKPNNSKSFDANIINTANSSSTLSLLLLTQVVNHSYNQLLDLPIIFLDLTGPTQQSITLKNFTREAYTYFKPMRDGIYKLNLINVGKVSVQINGLFGYLSYNYGNGQVDEDKFFQIWLGSMIFITGAVTLFVGIPIRLYDISKSVDRYMANRRNQSVKGQKLASV